VSVPRYLVCTLLHCGHNPVHQVRPPQLSVEKTQCHVKERPWSLCGALDPVSRTFILCVCMNVRPPAIVSNNSFYDLSQVRQDTGEGCECV